MYNNLRSEIVRSGYSLRQFADLVDIPLSTFSNKISGRTEFTIGEATRIKLKINELTEQNTTIDYLFN